MEFLKVLNIVAEYLEKQNARFAVIGALGLHAYGFSRATADLDLVVEEKARLSLVQHLESVGYESLHVSEGFSNHVHPLASLGRIDFVYIDKSTAEILFRNTLCLWVSGRIAPVPRAEYLAAMKILAMKNDSSRTFKEMADIQFILTLPGIDEQEIQNYFRKHGLENRYYEIKQCLARK